MYNYQSKLKTYYFTVTHPETKERKMVVHPAGNLELAYKVLVIKCGKEILDNIISVKTSN
jgi:hypothetical protein